MTARLHLFHPLAAEFMGLFQLLEIIELIDLIHQIVLIAVVNHRKERITIESLILEKAFFH